MISSLIIFRCHIERWKCKIVIPHSSLWRFGVNHTGPEQSGFFGGADSDMKLDENANCQYKKLIGDFYPISSLQLNMYYCNSSFSGKMFIFSSLFIIPINAYTVATFLT